MSHSGQSLRFLEQIASNSGQSLDHFGQGLSHSGPTVVTKMSKFSTVLQVVCMQSGKETVRETEGKQKHTKLINTTIETCGVT